MNNEHGHFWEFQPRPQHLVHQNKEIIFFHCHFEGASLQKQLPAVEVAEFFHYICLRIDTTHHRAQLEEHMEVEHIH